MKINIHKMKILICERKSKTKIQIKIRGNRVIEQVNEFIKLGSTINSDGREMKEIVKHICQA